jgi:hypothetical protein
MGVKRVKAWKGWGWVEAGRGAWESNGEGEAGHTKKAATIATMARFSKRFDRLLMEEATGATRV